MFGERENAVDVDNDARLHFHGSKPKIQDPQVVAKGETEKSLPASRAPHHTHGLHCDGRTGTVRGK